jgi:TolB-like protein
MVFKKIIFCLLLSLFLPSFTFSQEVISILYFENTTQQPEHEWLRKGLADMLITDISKAPEIRVVEREALEKILKEHALALSGVTDENQAVEMGRILNAHTLIYGSFIVTNKKIRIDAKISEVETGTIKASFDVNGLINQIFSVEKKLASKILEKLVADIPTDIASQETYSVDALKTYYEGIFFFDEGDFNRAKIKFQKAKDFDPWYLKPQEGLYKAYRFLKDYKKQRLQREVRTMYQVAEQLKERLAAPTLESSIDRIKATNFEGMSPRERFEFLSSICDKPIECTRRLMTQLTKIGEKEARYFNDSTLQKKLVLESYDIGEQARVDFKDDPYLPNLLIIQLDNIYFLKDFEKLKTLAEEFLHSYPDFAAISTVEMYYEKGLDALTNK